MAVYASQDDVLARAGRFGGVFSVAGKRPSLADLTALTEQVSEIVDAEVRSRGFDPDLLSADLIVALKDVVAWATLIRALPQANPGEDAEPLLERAEMIVRGYGFPGLASGGANVDVFAALSALEAGQGGGGAGAGAGSFWDSTGEEDSILSRLRRREPVEIVNGAIDYDSPSASEPLWRRGQSL